jgi:hypothetical protein
MNQFLYDNCEPSDFDVRNEEKEIHIDDLDTESYIQFKDLFEKKWCMENLLSSTYPWEWGNDTFLKGRTIEEMVKNYIDELENEQNRSME